MSDIIQRLKDAYAAGEHADILHTLLPELFQMYDDGLIPVLPCKVGTQIFKIHRANCAKCAEKDFKTFSSCKVGIGYFCGKESIKKEPFGLEMLDLFGKTVFLTRESAKNALKERKT